jgi:catechol 2,3-dioxygenase-like lactoylglutathione lyase family enzyme
MSPAERPLEGATIDHVALSVGDLDAMLAFYARLGFDEVSRADFAPAPVRTVLLQSGTGARLELTAHDESTETVPPVDAMDAARRRGLFHFAVRVASLDAAVEGTLAAGAVLLSGPAVNSRGDAHFAYLADPEGNLVELVSPDV